MWPIACGVSQNNKWQVHESSNRPILSTGQFRLMKPQCPEETLIVTHLFTPARSLGQQLTLGKALTQHHPLCDPRGLAPSPPCRGCSEMESEDRQQSLPRTLHSFHQAAVRDAEARAGSLLFPSTPLPFPEMCQHRDAWEATAPSLRTRTWPRAGSQGGC